MVLTLQVSDVTYTVKTCLPGNYHQTLFLHTCTVRTQLLPGLVPQILPAVIYNGRFQLSRQEFDQHIKPRTNGSNVLSGIGDGFNTNITVCNMTDAKVNLDWSYSRRARGDTDALFDNSEGAKTRGVTGTIPEALVEELSSYQLADPWGRYVNAEAIKQHSVFQWVSRCVFVPTEEAKKNGQQGVVFVGDAWHTMPVFSGKGGNHGVLDSVELAMAIVEKDSLEQAISAYYDGARHRVEEAVKRSKTRFFWLHRPMAEWQEVSEKRKMAEERVAKAGTVTA
jgi:monooxygenase